MYERYCKLRDAKGVNDATVSKATGIQKSTFSDWKHGRSAPKVEKLKKIADYFNVSLDYLMYGVENPAKFSDENAGLVGLIRNDTELSEALLKYSSMTDAKKKLVVDFINMLSEVEYDV
jgi:transcriptional regulator with XRE-family HTH domain